MLYATLRAVVGARSVAIPATGGITVRGLLDCVVTLHPALRPHLLDEHGALHGHVHVFINGRDAPYLAAGVETVLGPGDTVDLFPAVGGGSPHGDASTIAQTVLAREGPRRRRRL